jgi:hypothetical protein
MTLSCQSFESSVNPSTHAWLAPLWVIALMLGAASPANAASWHKPFELGVNAARGCEAEIDDDFAHYEECIGHAANRLPKQAHQQLGLHFQAWVMADLGARQAAARASGMRSAQQKHVKRLMRQHRIKLAQLAKASGLPSADLQHRWAQTM